MPAATRTAATTTAATTAAATTAAATTAAATTPAAMTTTASSVEVPGGGLQGGAPGSTPSQAAGHHPAPSTQPSSIHHASHLGHQQPVHGCLTPGSSPTAVPASLPANLPPAGTLASPVSGRLEMVGLEDALAYMVHVRHRLRSQPQVYNEFRNIMKEFKPSRIQMPEVVSRISHLFKEHPDLIVGFNLFLPPELRIKVLLTAQDFSSQVLKSMANPTSSTVCLVHTPSGTIMRLSSMSTVVTPPVPAATSVVTPGKGPAKRSLREMTETAEKLTFFLETSTVSGEQPRKKQKWMPSSRGASQNTVPVTAVRPFLINGEPAQGPLTIHKAAANGDVGAIRLLLDEGVHIDIRDRQGNTALHCAVENNREEEVKFLVQKGANVSLRGGLRNTALHMASYFGRDYILVDLIEAGSNLNAVNSRGQTPLILACMKANLECVNLLLICEADSNKPDKFGLTPLMYTVQHSGVNQSAGEDLEKKYLQIAEKLIKKEVNVNAVDFEKQSALHYAASIGSVKMISILRKAGANHSLVDTGGRTPLSVAGLNGHKQAVYEILEFLPEGEVPEDSMERAAAKGHINFMKVLFEAFGSEPFRNCGPFSRACVGGHLECVQLLIQKGFDVNQHWYDGKNFWNPLQCSARLGNVDILRELLKAGAKVDGRFSKARPTAVYYAAYFGHRECVEELLKYGAEAPFQVLDMLGRQFRRAPL